VTGDEHYWDTTTKGDFEKVFGNTLHPKSYKGLDFWTELKKHYNVFHIKKPYGSEDDEIIA